MGGLGPPRRLVRLLAALTALAGSGCASIPDHGVIHVVRPGENVFRISRYYGVHERDIVRANEIDDLTSIQVGERLLIPGTRKAPAVTTLAVAAIAPAPPASRARAHREAGLDFSWPVRGKLSSSYGRRNGRSHEGIDIPAKKGTTVRAAEAGRVIHSGRGLGAYGNVVIVKHAGRYSTVYAHNRKNRVKKGQFVEKGETIAEVGRTGNASGSHLHFEVRRDGRAQDPLKYLP